ncbi:MAG: indole-3-glycerol phosphate synthase TrpC [Pseudomonadota bacterium]
MILDNIVERTRIRVERAKRERPVQHLKMRETRDFVGALRCAEDMAVIAEIKKASPSKGIIDPEFNYLEIAKAYQSAGVTAVSVLTEPEFFMGANEILTAVSEAIELPILRKDFTIDEYQIFEARAIGADAVLLIAAVLETEKLREFLQIAREQGLAAIVEVHDEGEAASALQAGAEIVGVNNRNLKTFEVDLGTSLRLRALIPKDIIFISESGIETAQDIARLRDVGVNGVLIGETLMRAVDKGAKLRELLS